MAQAPDSVFARLRAWLASRALAAAGKKERQRLNAAVLMPTLALFAALGAFLSDGYFTGDARVGPSATPPTALRETVQTPEKAGAEATVLPATASPSASPLQHAQTPLAQTPDTDELRVFVPKSGARYHKTADCSGMEAPEEVTLRQARERGYTPCKRCKPPE